VKLPRRRWRRVGRLCDIRRALLPSIRDEPRRFAKGRIVDNVNQRRPPPPRPRGPPGKSNGPFANGRRGFSGGGLTGAKTRRTGSARDPRASTELYSVEGDFSRRLRQAGGPRTGRFQGDLPARGKLINTGEGARLDKSSGERGNSARSFTRLRAPAFGRGRTKFRRRIHARRRATTRSTHP